MNTLKKAQQLVKTSAAEYRYMHWSAAIGEPYDTGIKQVSKQ